MSSSPSFQSLRDHFLIAMPGLKDPNFSRSLTYVCEHSEEGAMGIIINRPSDLVMGNILDQLSFPTENEAIYQSPVFQGGPVQPERGFVIHNDNSIWDSTLTVVPGISVTTSKDILEAISLDRGPEKTFMALGYAGWTEGQLEQELADNAWLSGPGDAAILFDAPVEQRLESAALHLGIDLNLISIEAGHA
jgi:putative transcriptional regulator